MIFERSHVSCHTTDDKVTTRYYWEVFLTLQPTSTTTTNLGQTNSNLSQTTTVVKDCRYAKHYLFTI